MTESSRATHALTRLAPAKVNLSLRVTGKRADGYHELDSLIAFAEAGDRLTAGPDNDLSLAVTGPFAGKLATEPDNLVLGAARVLAAEAGVAPQARLTLDKQLPVAAGIGGGSADAAAALRILCELWDIAPEPAALDRLALGLGADVPICLHGRAAFVGGIGETIEPCPPLPPAWLVLVNPGVAVSTPAVFKSREPTYAEPVPRWTEPPSDAQALAARLRDTPNDLEAPARRIAPEIGDVLDQLRGTDGCLLGRMSGSGATCFGLYGSGDAAETAAQAVAAARPAWWVKAARLVG